MAGALAGVGSLAPAAGERKFGRCGKMAVSDPGDCRDDYRRQIHYPHCP